MDYVLSSLLVVPTALSFPTADGVFSGIELKLLLDTFGV
jgi:hypothetical protein